MMPIDVIVFIKFIWGGVGHAGVGWVMQGCGGPCRGGVGHAEVRWIMHCGSCRGGSSWGKW